MADGNEGHDPTILEEILQFNKGDNEYSYRVFGCHPSSEDGKYGYRFTMWYPQAQNICLLGDFNDWVPENMERVEKSSIWTLFREGAYEGDKYKYQILTKDGVEILKADPFATQFSFKPESAAVITFPHQYGWTDDAWIAKRTKENISLKEMKIYQLDLGTLKKNYNGKPYTFDDFIEKLIPLIKSKGYTHIEFSSIMPKLKDIDTELLGSFSVSNIYGGLLGFKRFIEAAHQEDVGILIEWVPGNLYQTKKSIGNILGIDDFKMLEEIAVTEFLEKPQVQSFLISNAIYWFNEFHIDGVRISKSITTKNKVHDEAYARFVEKLENVILDAFPGVIIIDK